MNRYFFSILIGFIILALLSGCGGGNSEKMYKARKKGPAGMPTMQPPVSKDKKGEESIKLNEEISYPGMVSYEGAKYEYTAEDSPQKVVDYFTEKLKGAILNKKSGRSVSETEWVFLFKKYEIVIATGPKGSDTLIRYKLAPKK